MNLIVARIENPHIRSQSDGVCGDPTQRVGIQGCDRGIEHLDLAAWETRLQLCLKEARHAESGFWITEGCRLTQHQYPQRSGFLLFANLQGPRHPGLGLADIGRTEGRISSKHSVPCLQPKGRGAVMSSPPQGPLDS